MLSMKDSDLVSAEGGPGGLACSSSVPRGFLHI